MMLGLGGGNAISAGFRIYLKDDFSPGARRVRAGLKGMGMEVGALRENLMGAKRLYMGIAGGAGMATAGMLRLAGAGAEFGFKMSHVKAITRSTTQELAKLKKLAHSLAGETIFSPTEISDAMKFAAMAGQSGATVAKSITPATYLAQATDTALGGKGGAMDIVTNIMKGFGMADSQLSTVADQLTAATLSANTNLVDLGRAIKYTSATAMDMGVSFKETTAMVMVLGNAGMQSSQAGTAVENMMRYFARSQGGFATKSQKKAMSMLGYTQKDFQRADGKLKSWSEVFKLINAGTKGLNPKDKQAALEKIFGVRGKRAGSAISRLSEDYDKFLNTLDSSGGMAQSVAEGMMDNLQGEWKKTISAWASFAAAWSEALAPLLRPILQFATFLVKGITKVMSTPVLGTVISGLLLFGAALVTATAAIGAMSMMIATMGGAFTSLKTMLTSSLSYMGAHRLSSSIGLMGTGHGLGSGSKMMYSEKRGMYYSKNRKGGISWQKRGYSPPGLAKGGMGGLGKIGTFLGRGVKFLGRMIPFLGPIMIGLSALTWALDAWGPAIMDLIRGTDDNTRAIESQYELYKGTNLLPNQAIAAMYSGQTTDVLTADILKVLQGLQAQGATASEISEMQGNDLLNALTENNLVNATPATK